MNPLALLQELVLLPGPPGQEDSVRDALTGHVTGLGYESTVDLKGNLIVRLGQSTPAKTVVTAHMDEIALMVKQVRPDGTLSVVPLGGLHPWKLGEGLVLVMAASGSFEAILGFGSIHTESELSPAFQAKSGPLTWTMANIFTGLSYLELVDRGVAPGTRVVVAPSRRSLTILGDHVAGYFLDDRADLVSWLLALESLRGQELDVTFVATVSEEVGGEGALYFLQREPTELCIALELGPNVPDAAVEISATPTLWVGDSYATMPPSLINQILGLGIAVQHQALSRGGSDASIATNRGLCAHPLTLGIPMENSHGYEVIHKDSMVTLAQAVLKILTCTLHSP